METRAATGDDDRALAAVHRAAALARYADIFPIEVPPPSLPDLTREWARLIDAAAVARVAVDDGVVIGGIVVGVDVDVPAGWALRRLYVHPDRWGGGAGSMLHDEAIAAVSELGLRSLDLWVLEANIAARAFYERRGWSLVPDRILHNDPPDVVDVMYELQLRAP